MHQLEQVVSIYIICVGVTNPIAVAEYATVAVTSGVMINGIIKIGFSTIGNPNMTGSLILKIPGTIQVLDNAFEYFDRPNIIIANTSLTSHQNRQSI